MCGITTLISNKLEVNQLLEFREVFKKQENRGGDSSGIYIYTGDKDGLFFDLKRYTDKPIKELSQFIINNRLIDKPVVIMGHTRATATGSNMDFHPAISELKNQIMTHNGVIYDEYGYYYHPNDTYHLVNLLDYEVYTKRDKKGLKNRISTSGSTIFNLNKDKKLLEFCCIGYTPLLLKSFKNYNIFCSTSGIDNTYKQIKDGFYKINLERLFNQKKIKIQDSIKYIEGERWETDNEVFYIVNGKKRGGNKKSLWNSTEYYTEKRFNEDTCNIHKEGYCNGCMICAGDHYTKKLNDGWFD